MIVPPPSGLRAKLQTNPSFIPSVNLNQALASIASPGSESTGPAYSSSVSSVNQTKLPEVMAPEISQALAILKDTRNLPKDEQYLKTLGVNIIFHTGQDALDVIRSKNLQVIFGDMGDSLAHAQYIEGENGAPGVVMINQKYRGDLSKPTLYAIAAAIYHEAGHAAALGDSEDSIQEEIDCLALNTLAYRAHVAKDPGYAQAVSNSRLLSDGVALYPKLFFEPDPLKRALIKRIIEKYGQLPISSPDHPVPYVPGDRFPLALAVWNTVMTGYSGLYLSQRVYPNQVKPVPATTAFPADLQHWFYYPAEAVNPSQQWVA